MLARVAGENYPAFVGLNPVKEGVHLLAADLPGLIHKDDCPTRQVTAREKGADGFDVLQTVFLQVHHLLSLRRDDLNDVTSFPKSTLHFTQGKRFSCPCTASKKGQEIPRAQNDLSSLPLFVVQLRADRPIRAKWFELGNPLSRHANNIPFTLQVFTSGDFAGVCLVPHVIATASDGLKVFEVYVLPSGMFQRVSPKLVLMDDRVPVEQMLFGS